jgi:hypothetical protein
MVHTPVTPSQKFPPAQSRVAEQGAPGRPFPGSAQVPPAQTLPPEQSRDVSHGVPVIEKPLVEQPAIAAATMTISPDHPKKR